MNNVYSRPAVIYYKLFNLT